MSYRIWSCLITAVLVTATGCTSDPTTGRSVEEITHVPGTACVPGDLGRWVSCPGDDASTGCMNRHVQRCLPDTMAWSTCALGNICPPADTTPTTTTCDSTAECTAGSYNWCRMADGSWGLEQCSTSCHPGSCVAQSTPTCGADPRYAMLGGACDNGSLGACRTTGTLVCNIPTAAVVCNAPAGAAPVAETCNNVDDDCNGTVDDMGTASCGTGRCAVTVTACTAGVLGVCTPGAPAAESCNGADDDCDGVIDNLSASAAHCYGGPAMTEGVGICRGGLIACVAGVPGACVGEVRPGTEACDGLDNDCNGLVDDLPPISCGMGFCSRTVPACVGGAPNTCTPGVGMPESCNGMDDNCDGLIDNGMAAITCGLVGSTCARSVPACTAGVPGVCVPGAPGVESCNGLDDNCNGSIDEGIAPASCYTGPAGTSGVGICRPGTSICTGGAPSACSGSITPQTEICDGLDNNCDGITDPGCPTGSPDGGTPPVDAGAASDGSVAMDAGTDSGTDAGTDSGSAADSGASSDSGAAADAGPITVVVPPGVRFVVDSTSGRPCTDGTPISGLTDAPGYRWEHYCYSSTIPRPSTIQWEQWGEFSAGLPNLLGPAITVPAGAGAYTTHLYVQIVASAPSRINLLLSGTSWAVGISTGTTRVDNGVTTGYSVVGGVQTLMTLDAWANGPCTGLDYHPRGGLCLAPRGAAVCALETTYPCL